MAYHTHTNTSRARRNRNTSYTSALGTTILQFVQMLGWVAAMLVGSGALLGLGLAASAFGWWLGINYPM